MPENGRQQLADTIARTFNESELRQLCFDLGVPYERLPGAEIGQKIIELIAFMERRDRADKLLGYCQAHRPGADWPNALPPPSQESLQALEPPGGDQIKQNISISGEAQVGNVTQIGKESGGSWLRRLWRKLF